MRLELIGALRDIGYADAVPTLRRLSNEDRDAEVRAEAVTGAVALERALKNAAAAREFSDSSTPAAASTVRSSIIG
jgi:hypothetical protein